MKVTTPLYMHKDYANLYMDADNRPVFSVDVYDDTLRPCFSVTETKQIRELILTACNAHYELLDLAQAVVTAFGDKILPTHTEKHLLDGARAAIAKAEGGAA